MKTMRHISWLWMFGMLAGLAGATPLRGDDPPPAPPTYTVSFESYEVRGKTYSVNPIKGLESGATLPKLATSTLHDWLRGWADGANTQYYDGQGNPLVAFTADHDVVLHALIDQSAFVHALNFTSYTLGGQTYSVNPIDCREGEVPAALPSTAVHVWVLGWYTGKNGTGTQYYRADGTPAIAKFTSEADVTLHAKLDPNYLPLGVKVNGQELDRVAEAGRSGEGWVFDFDRRLVTLDGEAGEYVLSGTHENGNVHFLVATNATLVLSNLVLKTSSTARPGLIDLARGAKVEVQLAGENSLDASAAGGVAGIFCPTGTSVKIWSARKREVSMSNPTNMSYHGVLSLFDYDGKDLVAKGGASAAAIGGRQSTDGGLSGAISIQNCALWASGGAGACEVGAGSSSFTTAQTNACGTVRLLDHPNVRLVDQGVLDRPRICPIPHGDWETPLFPMEVASMRPDNPSQRIEGVYWFPYGTTWVRTTTVVFPNQFCTNEIPYTVSHRNR